jgi:hypothetical protein
MVWGEYLSRLIPLKANKKLRLRSAVTAASLRFVFGNAGIAQLVEQLICNQQVVGSNPTAGSPSNAVNERERRQRRERKRSEPWSRGEQGEVVRHVCNAICALAATEEP